MIKEGELYWWDEVGYCLVRTDVTDPGGRYLGIPVTIIEVNPITALPGVGGMMVNPRDLIPLTPLELFLRKTRDG